MKMVVQGIPRDVQESDETETKADKNRKGLFPTTPNNLINY